MSSTANQTSTANITSTINGAIITCSSITGTTCHMTAASATWNQSNSTHGAEHTTAATCITTTAAILETRGSSDERGGAQRQTGKSTTSQKPPGGNSLVFPFQCANIFFNYNKLPKIQQLQIKMITFLGGEESSESETDNNEDSITCVKFLLLVDQLSIDQHHHLSIKDIGNQLNCCS